MARQPRHYAPFALKTRSKGGSPGMKTRRVRRWFAPVCVVCAGMWLFGCGRAPERTALLGPGPSGPQPEPSATPASRYVPISPGLLSITRYNGALPAGYSVHIRDLLVGPHQSARNVTFGGSTILFVTGGAGRFERARSEATVLRGGAQLVFRFGERFNVVNGSAGSLSMRAITFRSK